AGGEQAASVRNTAKLHVAIFQPIRVMAASARRAACVGTLAIDYGDCGFVGFHDVFPHAQSQENMRSHVLRVASFGGKLRVDACGAQAEGRVDGVVVAVNEVVDYSRMV